MEANVGVSKDGESDVSGLTEWWNSMLRLRGKRNMTYVAWILQNATVPMSDPLKGEHIGVMSGDNFRGFEQHYMTMSNKASVLPNKI